MVHFLRISDFADFVYYLNQSQVPYVFSESPPPYESGLGPFTFFTLGNQILLYVIRSNRSILLIDAPVTTSNSNVMSLSFT